MSYNDPTTMFSSAPEYLAFMEQAAQELEQMGHRDLAVQTREKALQARNLWEDARVMAGDRVPRSYGRRLSSHMGLCNCGPYRTHEVRAVGERSEITVCLSCGLVASVVTL